MSDDDDFDSDEGFDFDRTGEDDARVRELLIEMTRLQAMVDQLMAADEERGAQIAELRRDMDDLIETIARVKQARAGFVRRVFWMGICGALVGSGLAQAVIAVWF